MNPPGPATHRTESSAHGLASDTDAVGRLGTILSVWAHPDDETYLAAGVMSTASSNGQRVVCASASAGERGTSEPQAWPPERLGPVRRLEAKAAMAILGISEHTIGDLPDGDLPRHHADGARWIESLIDEVRPDTILTFGPDGQTFHPDHIAVHRWVTAAWERRGRSERLLYSATTLDHIDRFGAIFEQWNVYMTDQRPVGVRCEDLALELRLGGHLLDRKLAALAAMATQTAAARSLLGPELYAEQAATEAFVDAERP